MFFYVNVGALVFCFRMRNKTLTSCGAVLPPIINSFIISVSCGSHLYIYVFLHTPTYCMHHTHTHSHTIRHLSCTMYHVPCPCTMYHVPCTHVPMYHVPCTVHASPRAKCVLHVAAWLRPTDLWRVLRIPSRLEGQLHEHFANPAVCHVRW
jgi:hypothetical protein